MNRHEIIRRMDQALAHIARGSNCVDAPLLKSATAVQSGNELDRQVYIAMMQEYTAGSVWQELRRVGRPVSLPALVPGESCAMPFHTAGGMGLVPVREGDAIPMMQGRFGAVHPVAFKLAGLVSMTAEAIERAIAAPAGLPAMLLQAVRSELIPSLDAALLGSHDSAAGDGMTMNGLSLHAKVEAATDNPETDLATVIYGSKLAAPGKRPWVLVLPAVTLAKMRALRTKLDAVRYPSLLGAAPTLAGVPVVAAETGLTDSALLIDTGRLMLSEYPSIIVDRSEHALIHEVDTDPSKDLTAGSAQPLRGLYQTNSAALRCVSYQAAASVPEAGHESAAIKLQGVASWEVLA